MVDVDVQPRSKIAGMTATLARPWLPSVSRYLGQDWLRLGGGGSVEWLVRRAGVGAGAGRAGVRVVSSLPSRARRCVRCDIGEHGSIDGVGESAFEASHCFHRGLAG